MKRSRSLIVKITLIVLVVLAVVFTTINVITVRIIKQEVLEQWKTEDAKLVDAYAELMLASGCTTPETAQEFVEKLNTEHFLNYALFIQVVDGEVTAVAHSNRDRIGLVLKDEGSIAAARDGEAYVGYFTDEVSGKRTLDVLTPVYDSDNNLLGALNLGIPVDEATISAITAAAIKEVTTMAVAASLLLLAILCVVIFFLVVLPLKQTCVHIDRIAKYDLTPDDTGMIQKNSRRQDEIGVISNDIESMRESIIQLVTDIRRATGELAGQSEALAKVSANVAQMSEQMTQTVNDVANGATNQAEETQEGEKHVVEMGQMIELARRNMDTMNQATDSINQLKEEGLQALGLMLSNTEKNSDNSLRVHEVIMETSRQTDKIKEASAQIREIASQTNLLALNASIEAARAGDAGRGFAVVATEIGNLAGGTNELTARIEEVIHELVDKMQLAVKTMDGMQEMAGKQMDSALDTQRKFDRIAENIVEMEENCRQLDLSTKKIEESKNAIVGIVSDLSAISQENAACMEEAAASVEEESHMVEKVSQSSAEVEELAEQLKLQIGKFKL